MSADSSGNVVLPGLPGIEAAAARIRDLIPETPLVAALDLGDDLGQPLWLKAENLQRTGSFKARGALNWIRTATPAETANGLITVSAGNHALALAWAAREVGVSVTVVMPEGSSPLKVRGTEAYGAKVILHGSIQEAVAHTHRLREELGLTLVHPYNDPRVMAGQGTVGLELLRQLPAAARILCPVGGGGLISGLGLAVKALRPDIELIGVEPAGAATLRNAWDKRDHRASLDRIDTIAVSLGPVIVGEYTYAASRQVVDGVVTVGDDAIRVATQRLILRGRLYVETGASVGIAALLEGSVAADLEKPTVAILTGANMDPQQCRDLLTEHAPT